MIRTILTIVIIVGLAELAAPQGESTLINESGDAGCEFVWNNLDHLLSEMSRNPTATATVDISGKAGDLAGNFYWEQMVRNYLSRRHPRDRWSVRRAAWGTERRFEYWLTHPGATPPVINEATWSFEYPADTKPFIFTEGENYSVSVGVCIYVDEIELLSRALNANPKARLNVVLITPTEHLYQRRKAKTLAMLTRDYSIERRRIRVFRKVGNPKPGYPEPNAEYWFVPGAFSKPPR